jgi:membrane protein
MGSVPGFGDWSARTLLHRLWREVAGDFITSLAAALAYYAMLAVFPFFIFLVALIGFIPLHGVDDTLIEYVHRVAPADAASIMEQAIRQVTTIRRPSLLVVALAGSAFSAASGMWSLLSALDRMSDVPPAEARPIWLRAPLALALTLMMTVACIVSLVLLAVHGPLLRSLLDGSLPFRNLWTVLRWPVAAAVLWTALALLFWLGPSRRPRFRWLAPGTLLAVPAWFLLTELFSQYVRHLRSYSKLYGPFASVIVMLVWFYLSALVLLVGAKLNALSAEARGEEPAPARFSPAARKKDGSRSPPRPALGWLLGRGRH